MLSTVWIVSRCVLVSRTQGKRSKPDCVNGFVSIPELQFIFQATISRRELSLRGDIFHCPPRNPPLFPSLQLQFRKETLKQ